MKPEWSFFFRFDMADVEKFFRKLIKKWRKKNVGKI